MSVLRNRGASTSRQTLDLTVDSTPSDLPISTRQFSAESYDSTDVGEFLFEDDLSPPTGCALHINKFQGKLKNGWSNNRSRIKAWFLVVLGLLYIAYFGYAMHHKFHVGLLVLTILVVAAILVNFLWKRYGGTIKEKTKRHGRKFGYHWRKWMRWVFLAICFLLIVTFIGLDIGNDKHRLISLSGIVVYIFVTWITSVAPSRVSWHIVFSGIFLQVVLGFVILRWNSGFRAFEWFAEQAVIFLDYTDAGSTFVFGSANDPESWRNHEFLMKSLMAILFFGACVNLLYYWGILQKLITSFGSVMQVIMNIGPIEAFCAAANVFLGPNTSALTVRSFLDRMTLSELHCIFTSGFSTVTGSMFAAYQGFGVPTVHLVAASVMSAPAALSLAKLSYPETRKSKLNEVDKVRFDPPKERTAIEAFSGGASSCVIIVASIVANLVAFVALLQFANLSVSWFAERVGVELTLEKLTGWIFTPFAFLMGVEWQDCDEVGLLLGTKIFLTEIVGYIKLGEFIRNREEDLGGPTISARSETIATYALCGFASFADAGIMLGAIGAMAPRRKSDMTKIVLRAMIAGNLSCWISACIAGFLYKS